MEGHIDSDYGKMGTGVVRYLLNPIVGVIDKKLAGNQIQDYMVTDKKAPILAHLSEAIKLGAEVLILGIAPSGGRIPESWNQVIEEALNAGLSIVNGLHDLLNPVWGTKIPFQKNSGFGMFVYPSLHPILQQPKPLNSTTSEFFLWEPIWL